jgi:hypothetical protein
MDYKLVLASCIGRTPEIRIDDKRYEFKEFDAAPREQREKFAREIFEWAKLWSGLVQREREREESDRRVIERERRAIEEEKANARATLSRDRRTFEDERKRTQSERVLEAKILDLREEKSRAERGNSGILVEHINEKIIIVQNKLIEIERKSQSFNRMVGIAGLVGLVIGLIGLLVTLG